MTTSTSAPITDIASLLRARNSLIWVVSREEARVERCLFQAAASAGYVARCWDCVQGVTDANGQPVSNIGAPDPANMFETILSRARGQNQGGAERGVWIMRDLPPWLAPPIGTVQMRQLRNLARFLPTTPRESAQAIIVLSTVAELPPELAGHATVVEWAIPDRAEIGALLDASIQGLPEEYQADALGEATREAAIDAAVGLTAEEAQACYARSLVQQKRIDPAIVAREKKRVIARERVLEWYDPIPGGLDAVGGLDNLKSWLVRRASAYSQEAREYGLPAPRGAMLVGVPGCGKSLTAKAIATAWGVPLLRLDLGALKSKFVGDSEANLRKAFKVIEAIGRCVVWIDEVEKALQGATSGSSDGGVSADALGGILSWMQERQGEAFVIATANDVSALPPELLRKGRFDEVWFVDLPNAEERKAIIGAALKAHKRGTETVDLDAVAKITQDFTGSEIAALVPDALYAAFADGVRQPVTEDLLDAAKTVVPLAKTAAEKIAALRAWANGRARPATSQVSSKAAKGRTVTLDI